MGACEGSIAGLRGSWAAPYEGSIAGEGSFEHGGTKLMGHAYAGSLAWVQGHGMARTRARSWMKSGWMMGARGSLAARARARSRGLEAMGYRVRGLDRGRERAGRCAYGASKRGGRGSMGATECLPAWARCASKTLVRGLEGEGEWERTYARAGRMIEIGHRVVA